MTDAHLSFPLVPSGRLIGLSFGSMRSLQRGTGSDVAGSRPYRPGDDVHAIDWAASARLSAARSSDEFVVREAYAEQAPKVVVVCDRRPEMSFHSPPFPWLEKPLALRRAIELILHSTTRAGGFVGYLDYGDGAPYWRPPQGARRSSELREERLSSAAFSAPADVLELSLAHLAEHRRALTAGTFLFVLSDFLAPPPAEAWLAALEYRWDIVPVVIQDATWEQSFPDIRGVVVPLRDPRSGRVAPVRLTAREVAVRAEANEQRLERLLAGFRSLGIDPVLVSSSEQSDILASFLAWTELRRARRHGRH